MPADYPLFPSRDQVLAYLNAYADHFALRQHIRFGTGVDSVVPVATTGSVGSAGWVVTTTDGRAQHYDGVFVANGHLHDQRIPDVPGTFTGKQIHSGSYGNTADIDGDRVLVIGSGNSGCDIAVDAAQSRLTTAICIRQRALLPTQDVLRRPARGARRSCASSPSRSRTCSPGC